MSDLTYSYKRGSTLPKRQFVVSTTRWDQANGGEPVDVAVTVTAPDPLAADNVVRHTLRTGLLDGWQFSVGMCREVTTAWNTDAQRYLPTVRVVWG